MCVCVCVRACACVCDSLLYILTGCWMTPILSLSLPTSLPTTSAAQGWVVCEREGGREGGRVAMVKCWVDALLSLPLFVFSSLFPSLFPLLSPFSFPSLPPSGRCGGGEVGGWSQASVQSQHTTAVNHLHTGSMIHVHVHIHVLYMCL